MTQEEGLLSGLLVVELTRVIVGPAIGRTLADYGGRVVRVQSSHYPDTGGAGIGARDPGVGSAGGRWNFNKESITLNLRTDEGRELLDRLLTKADVFVENNAGGAIDRLGYDYDRVSRLNPSIIMVSTSMFVGPEPWSRFRGYGNQAAGITGFQNLVGYENESGISAMAGPYTDFTSPPLAVAAILAALRHRRRTGKGQYIRQGQGQSVLFLEAGLLLGHRARGVGDDLTHLGNHDLLMTPHNCFEAADERWCAVAVRHVSDWRALCAVLGWSDYAADESLDNEEARRSRQGEIDDRLALWFAARPGSEAVMALQAAGIPASPVLEPDELPAHPQFSEREAWQQANHRDGSTYLVHNLPYRISGAPVRHWSAPVPIGEDTFEVLTTLLDVKPEDVAGLYANGVLD